MMLSSILESMIQRKEDFSDSSFGNPDSLKTATYIPGALEPIPSFPPIHSVDIPREQQSITLYEKEKVVMLPEGYRRISGNYTWEAFAHLVLAEGPVSDDELHDSLTVLKDKDHLPGNPSVEKTIRFLRHVLNDEHGILVQRVITNGFPGYQLNAKVTFAEADDTPQLQSKDILRKNRPPSHDLFNSRSQPRSFSYAGDIWKEHGPEHHELSHASKDSQVNKLPREDVPTQLSQSESSWKEDFFTDIADIKFTPSEKKAVEAFVHILVGKSEIDFVGTAEWESVIFDGKKVSKSYISILKTSINSKLRSTHWQITNFAKGKLPAQLKLIKEKVSTE